MCSSKGYDFKDVLAGYDFKCIDHTHQLSASLDWEYMFTVLAATACELPIGCQIAYPTS